MEDTPPILVLGIGNVQLADDGVGVRLLKMTQESDSWDERVEFVDGGTEGLALRKLLNNRKGLILMDCVSNGSEPGTIHKLNDMDLLRMNSKFVKPSKEPGAAEILKSAWLGDRLPSKIAIFSIEPDRVETKFGLTRSVESALPKAVKMIQETLHGMLQ